MHEHKTRRLLISHVDSELDFIIPFFGLLTWFTVIMDSWCVRHNLCLSFLSCLPFCCGWHYVVFLRIHGIILVFDDRFQNIGDRWCQSNAMPNVMQIFIYCLVLFTSLFSYYNFVVIKCFKII